MLKYYLTHKENIFFKSDLNYLYSLGVHAISINPSRTLLATGAEHVNDVAIYSLPDLEPVMVGFKAHSYWIFDILWLDDEHVVSGAGDNRLALWSVGSGSNNNRIYMKNSSENFVHRNKAPMAEFYPYKCKKISPVRE